ncbi:MAG: prepilin peptidase [Candidatus Omnitrophota bacterium]
MELILIFIFGAIIGSFLNVCIYRIPLGKSIVFPGSFCPVCKKPIPWFSNIPLLSFIALRGKCRYCRTPIPLRYFLVELVTGLSGIGLFLFFAFNIKFVIFWFLVCILITVTAIDIEHQEIPDVITIPGIAAGVLLMTIFKLDGAVSCLSSFLNSAAGVAAGGGSMFLLGVAGELIFRKEALGGGDVKLMAMLGAFLGWKLILVTFFIAPLFGACVGIFMKIKFRSEIIPYGPFLSLGAVFSLLYGEQVLKYLFAGY